MSRVIPISQRILGEGQVTEIRDEIERMDDFFKSYNHIERIIGDYLPGDAAQSAINELAKVREKLLMSAKDSLNKICKLTQEVEK